MHYDLTDLRLFISIAEANNLTRGAERVHLSASSASHRVRMLEESIGTALLVREARGVSLTRAGEALLRSARQVVAQLEQMHADLAPYAHGVRGHVSLWANTHATHTFLPDGLSAFLQRHPHLSISLEEHTSPDVVMAVARGEVEVGVISDVIDGAEVELLPYREDRLVLIVPPQHSLATHDRAPFAAVLDYPFVMLHAGSAIHTFTMNAAAKLGKHLDVRIQVRSFEAVCRMVSAGVGIGLVPYSAIRVGAPHMPLAVLELDEPWAQRNLKICVRKREQLSGFAAELVAGLLDNNHGSVLQGTNSRSTVSSGNK